MPKDVFQFACPCCGKRIEVNVRSGRARAVKPHEAKGGQDLESLLEKQKQEGERLTDVFQDAMEQQKSDLDRLSDMLEKAKEDAAKDEKKRPPNIFDLD